MQFLETRLPGVFEIRPEPHCDHRGFFARTWCRDEFEAHGLNPRLVQCSISFNTSRGTLRGMHFQLAPHAETKLVRCTSGAIYDVILDLRTDSPTYREWVGVCLTAQNRHMIYVAEGCAHGFITMQDQTEVFYQMSDFHAPAAARGVRWNDPAFGIAWPTEVQVISDRDATWPAFG